jgi:hypothetical protein
MEIPLVLGISVLCQKTCVTLEVRALLDIKLQGRLAWELEDETGFEHLFFGCQW